MQKIFSDYEFKIDTNKHGVHTTTITAPPGMTFFFFNTGHSNTPELAHAEISSQILRNAKGIGQLTLAGYYTLVTLPFTILTTKQAADLVAIVDAKYEAHGKLLEASSAAKKYLNTFLQ